MSGHSWQTKRSDGEMGDEKMRAAFEQAEIAEAVEYLKRAMISAGEAAYFHLEASKITAQYGDRNNPVHLADCWDDAYRRVPGMLEEAIRHLMVAASARASSAGSPELIWCAFLSKMMDYEHFEFLIATRSETTARSAIANHAAAHTGITDTFVGSRDEWVRSRSSAQYVLEVVRVLP
jgi:hypothetical protein